MRAPCWRAAGYSKRQQGKLVRQQIASANSPNDQGKLEPSDTQETLRKLAAKDRAEAAALTAQAEALAKAEQEARAAVAASLGEFRFMSVHACARA